MTKKKKVERYTSMEKKRWYDLLKQVNAITLIEINEFDPYDETKRCNVISQGIADKVLAVIDQYNDIVINCGLCKGFDKEQKFPACISFIRRVPEMDEDLIPAEEFESRWDSVIAALQQLKFYPNKNEYSGMYECYSINKNTVKKAISILRRSHVATFSDVKHENGFFKFCFEENTSFIK